MTATQLESEQALVLTMERNTVTLQKLIQERDVYRDALMKIARIRYQGLTFEEKADRANEIANTVLGEFK